MWRQQADKGSRKVGTCPVDVECAYKQRRAFIWPVRRSARATSAEFELVLAMFAPAAGISALQLVRSALIGQAC